MPLYHVRDAERQAWVVARDESNAIYKWRWAVAVEKEIQLDEVNGPAGVSVVCDDSELMVDHKWLKPRGASNVSRSRCD